MIGRAAWGLLASLALLADAPGAASAQSRIKTMPGYETWREVAPRIAASVKSGAVSVTWSADSRSFDYVLDGSRWRYSVADRKAENRGPSGPVEPALPPASGAPAEALVLARGRGADADVTSPDGRHRAFSRDLNVWIAPAGGGTETQISTDGGRESRIRNGTGSYVYLEEFGVKAPVWWSPDSRKVAWMRFDESQVEDYFLPLDQTRPVPTLLTQAYPLAGAANPVADLLVHDIESGVTQRIDLRDGQPFSDTAVGHYAWSAQWTADGSDILVRRADRRQTILELAACSPSSGACRAVAREERPQAWAQGSAPTFLADGRRFVWASERTDFRNLYLESLDGGEATILTRHAFDVVDVVKIDERAGLMWYTARSGENHMMVQLHRVKLDGTEDRRLTDPALHHRVTISPNGRYFVDVAQTHDAPPVSRLLDLNGKALATIATSDLGEFDRADFRRAELFTFLAADGETELHGMLHFPSGFAPDRKYPILVSLYGGPGSNGAAETFAMPNALAEFGFVVVKLAARTAAGKGRKSLDAIHRQIGVVEIDDFAAGIRSLWSRPWFDKSRVGVFGTSYGGTVAATLIMRHPGVVQAAVSNSPVTDYRLYDTAYSERYLGLPQTDKAAYDRAAVLTHVDGLQGDLLIYYGSSDDNVHPQNALQLIRALQAAGKSFEVQVGPDRGHTSMDQTRMMEFFIQKLVLDRADLASDG